MQSNKKIKKLWEDLDKLLMAAVIILLTAVWLSARKVENSRKLDEGFGLGVHEKREPVKRVPSRVVEGMRVSPTADRRSRVSSIARSIAASDWGSVPRSLAMDMREQVDGKEYDIRLALPDNVDIGSVLVTAKGHTLTLRMRDGDSGITYLRHVRVPCRVAQDDGVRSVVSNGLLHVWICAE